jgi:uncharacterized protein (DUF1501 family)
MITRRELLVSTAAAAGIGAAAPQWMRQAVAAQQSQAKSHEKILVVVLFAGGNDGLNTVVPYADDRYRNARPTIRIDADKALKLDDHVGLHPSMKLLHDRYEKGEVAVLQGVGYPKPNRSHFRALDIWHSADPEAPPRTGWLGRYADGVDATREDSGLIVHFGSPVVLGVRREKAAPIALEGEDSFTITPDRKYPGDQAEQQAAFRKLCEIEENAKSDPRTAYTEIVRRTTACGLAHADEVSSCLKKTKNEAKYPRNLGAKLSLAARMIAGGMKTRVYFASLGGFDTHARQRDAHANLLQNFSEATDAFFQDLASVGREKDVLLVTFSEFGRRVEENASGGTDHGAAAPVFVLGGAVQGGLFGVPPDLEHLVDGDVGHTIDFRSVYTTLVTDWLGASAEPAVTGTFPTVPFLKSSA